MILKHHFINVNHNDYHVAINTVKKPKANLVMLHGLLECYMSFIPLMELFCSDYNIMAIDLPGFGDSGALPDFSAENVTRDLKEIIEYFDFKNPVIFGHSLGGIIALMLANSGLNVRKFVIMNSPYKTFNLCDEAIPYLKGIAGIRHSNIMLDLVSALKNSDLAEKIAVPFVDKFDKEMKPVNDKFGFDFLAPTIQKSNAKASGDFSNLMLNFDLTDIIRDLKVPALFIFSELDDQVKIETASEVTSVNPVVQIHIVKDYAHGVFIVAPEKIYPVILDFIGK